MFILNNNNNDMLSYFYRIYEIFKETFKFILSMNHIFYYINYSSNFFIIAIYEN